MNFRIPVKKVGGYFQSLQPILHVLKSSNHTCSNIWNLQLMIRGEPIMEQLWYVYFMIFSWNQLNFFLILLFSMSRKIFKKWNSIWLMKILQITGMSSQFEKNFQIWWPKECTINWRNYCHQCWSKFKKANLQTTRR